MPIAFIFEVSSQCNQNCAFCYNVWKEGKKSPEELSFDDICKVLKRTLKTPDVFLLAFAGGEPLLRTDLEEIIAFIKKDFPHIKIGIATNGVLLDEKRCNALVSSGADYFEIPLFAASQELYTELTGSDNLESVQKAICNVKKLGVPLTISSVLSKPIKDELETIIKMAFAFGATRLALNRFVPTGFGKIKKEDFLLSTQELEDLLCIANAKSSEYNFPIILSIPIEDCIISHKSYPHLKFSSCVCGSQKWVIDAGANLRICEQSDIVLGSLIKNSFEELSSLSKVKDFKNCNYTNTCAQCSAYEDCGGGCRYLKVH